MTFKVNEHYTRCSSKTAVLLSDFNPQSIQQLIMVSEIKLKAILPHTPHKFKEYTSNDFRKIVYNKDTLSIYGLIFLILACVLPSTKTREFYHLVDTR